MKLSTSFFSTILFASSILAAPSHDAEIVERREERRAPGAGSSFLNPVSFAPKAKSAVTVSTSSARNNTIYANWSGAIIQTPPTGTTYTLISGTFIVPEPKPPVSGPGTWSGAAWVGIYDDHAILQSGVEWAVTVDNSGKTSYRYNAVWEWLPNLPTNFELVVTAGDKITIACEAQSTSSATCVAINVSSGKKASQTLTAPSASSTLQARSAAWIVEDFSTAQLAFADFGEVMFTNCVFEVGVEFKDKRDAFLTEELGTVAGIIKGGKVVTAVTFPEEVGSFSVSYV